MKINSSNHEIPNKASLNGKKEILEFNLSSFVYPETLELFKILKIKYSFLDIDAQYWNDDDEYKDGLEVVKNLAVVNDAAERLIKMIQDYNGKLTQDQDGLFNVIELHKNLVNLNSQNRYEELASFLEKMKN